MWDMQNIYELILTRKLRQAPDKDAIGDDSDNDIAEIYPETRSIELANIVTSDIGLGYHYPVLDIDYEAFLVPSFTEGHYHLYLNQLIPWRKYKKVLKAMKEAGLIENGFYRAAIRRGYTSARLPWIKKDKAIF